MKATAEKVICPSSTPKQLFPAIAQEPGSVWLDSSLQIGDKGRYSFIARRPVLEISANELNLDDGLRELERLWSVGNLFSVGYISYEAVLPLMGVNSFKLGQSALPLLRFLFYESALGFDHVSGRLAATNPQADDYSDLFDSFDDLKKDFFQGPVDVSPSVSKTEYLEHVGAIKEHIREGDIYQANYTCRFEIDSRSNPFEVYQRLRHLNPAPYSAYLNFGNFQIISSSPERMFKKNGTAITSCPIKGTVKSGASGAEREIQRQKLLDSSKDKAELLMIVDLMRNDLGKIAQTGAVQVNNLFATEDYSSLIHLVTDVSAALKPKTTYSEIFSALMPGGSITGAPKRRAIEILQEQEATPRGVYTGCIGYIHGDLADFNIAIRTIVHQDGQYRVHAGGGIVADSDPEKEYQEMQLKAANLFIALGAKQDIYNA